MSKLVAFAAIQGGYKVVSTAVGAFNNALESYTANTHTHTHTHTHTKPYCTHFYHTHSYIIRTTTIPAQHKLASPTSKNTHSFRA